VLAAAVAARGESRPIAATDLVPAIAAEYRKLGRPAPPALGAERAPSGEAA
jgi:hypothetical protein